MEVSGIQVEVLKKNIKNLHLYVLPPDGYVRVSAPKSFSDKSIELFVKSKLGWIRTQQQKFAEQPRQAERKYVSGETLYVFGKAYYLLVEYSNKGNSLVLSGDKAVLTVRRESTAKQRESFVNEWYRSLLKEEILKYLPKWEDLTDLHCSSWQTKYMTTRWGSCNTDTKKIWINLQLAKKPVECLEYVILHELAHTKVKNHGADFIAILDKYMPDWREIRKRLNESKLDYMPDNKQ